MRVMLGVRGIAGHALPAIALARQLSRRGHEVLVHTTRRWRALLQEEGAAFEGGEHAIFEGHTGPGEPDIVSTATAIAASIDRFAPEVVISDGFTLAPALAAEMRDVRRVTLFPEVYPVHEPGLPFFPMGLLAPRTAVGAAAWRAAWPLLATRMPGTGWMRWARARLNDDLEALGLPPRRDFREPVTTGLTLVATFPQLEYPRRWRRDVHVTGPLILDLPYPTKLPPGSQPLVLVIPSTVKDPDRRLVRLAVSALSNRPVRVLASMSGMPARDRPSTPPNVRLVDWIDFAHALPEASLVVTNGTHGAVVRSLAGGVPLLVCPAMPDDAEHGARVAWAGAGLMVPGRLATPATIALAADRILADRKYVRRAREIAAWARGNDAAGRAADLVERHAAGAGAG
jgi:UDP:flavonoid glycosyltransferase YjiC (YdhE family)